MTLEIAATDAYQRSVDAVVSAVVPEGVVLDRTVFYPRGGGQPGDTGALLWEGGRAAVADTYRKAGQLVHQIGDGAPPVGAQVSAEIDWDRRYRLMRIHTALHALSGVVWRDYHAKVTGGNMQPGSARMDFELESMSSRFGEEVEERLNLELARNYPTTVLFLPRDEALADPDLIRTKVNLLPEGIDPIRVIDIVGLDKQADGGTHVRATLEVGRVVVTKTESKGRANKRIRIELGD